MAEPNTDTIAAIATPPGRGGVGIIRVSGPQAKSIAEKMLGKVPQPRFAEFLAFLNQNNEVIDSGLALYFIAPNSFTGEDVLELQGHGGPVVMDLLLQEVVTLGARIAKPGEFSERAFLNDKVDLAQAEAIADLIEAGSEQAAKSAIKSLQGEFSRWIDGSVEALTHLRMYVEAAIDFPEEEIDFLSDGHVTKSLENILAEMDRIFASAQQGVLLRDGMRVVLIGQPNTGKSSLLNALAGRDSAIVTNIAGTTRDVLREEINIEGMPLHIIDTAGLRESEDVVEQEGIKRTWIEIEQADRALLLVDDKTGITRDDEKIREQLPKSLKVTIVHNKIDLSEGKPTIKGQAGNIDIA
ncbi:MAG: tRNA uridine-5-carboxymethylaminomethyl(34) synthesis GTPase MnmE, partial [Gammaproteobacteria bacterium]|nr:tRNA uridine-5-carboxymethylaminomethyl(34) synthesis GTPase MnmE [Gammaproteobacteria bacterium]